MPKDAVYCGKVQDQENCPEKSIPIPAGLLLPTRDPCVPGMTSEKFS